MQLRIGNLKVSRRRDIPGTYTAFTLNSEEQAAPAIGQWSQTYSPEVQKEIDAILFHMGNRRKLVRHAFDLDLSHSRSRQRAQDYSPDSIAYSNTKSLHQRPDD